MTGYFRKYVSSGRWRSGGFEFEGPHGEPSNIFSKLVFQLAGEKKKDNELLRWGPVSSPNYTAHAK